nr:MAG TPA: hypothetical protein [Caudoviricetes sp.]
MLQLSKRTLASGEIGRAVQQECSECLLIEY